MWLRGRATGCAVTVVFAPSHSTTEVPEPPVPPRVPRAAGEALGRAPGASVRATGVPFAVRPPVPAWGVPDAAFPVAFPGAVFSADAVGIVGREAPSSSVPVPLPHAVSARAATVVPVAASRRIWRIRMASPLSGWAG